MRRFTFVLMVLALNLAAARRGFAQTWATNNPLNVARWAHTATSLGNGKVLITGGTFYNVGGIFADTNSCELYDPSTGSSSIADSMTDYRHSHTATLLNSGKVLVVGGSGGGTSELYDPTPGTWGQHLSMAHERLAHTATLLQNGTVLVAAGYDDSSGNELTSCELYDPSSGTWNNVGSLPYSFDSAAAVMLSDGRVLVCGGSDQGNSITNAVIFDPNSQTWSVTGSLQEPRQTHKAVLLASGLVLVVGGNGGNTPELFNPNTGTFAYAGTMNDGWYSPNLVTLDDGRVMVCGDDRTDVEVYDPDGDSWDYLDPLIVAANQQTATKITGGAVLVTGGSESTYNGPPVGTIQTYGSTVGVPTLVVTNNPTTGGVPLVVHFSSPGVDSDGNTVTNWNWDFGDGGTSTNQNPTYTYTNIGGFSPSLTAQSTFGAQNIIVSGLQSVSVTNHFINVSDSPLSGFVPLTVQFTSPSVDSGGNSITNWSWSFGDGGTSTNQSPAHTYNTVGTFYPSLVARSTYSSFPLDVYGPSSVNTTNSPDPNFNVLHVFNNVDGSAPNPGLLPMGNSLYGTTSLGGSNTYGIFYRVGLDGLGFTNLHTFDLNQGARPNGGLVTAGGGTVFGTTYIGGSQGGGTIFSIRTNGTGITNLYEFKLNLPNTGNQPAAGLAQGSGLLFGTTQFGGTYDKGVLAGLSTNGANFQLLHAWNPTSGNGFVNYDGIFPVNQLLLVGGTLYGTALGGGSFMRGTVFAMETNSPNSFRILHYFPDVSGPNATNTDGGSPYGGLVLVGNTLYGTTVAGGKYGNGTVYAISTDGLSFTNLHDFTGGNDGASSHGALVTSGNTLYGCAQAGGTANLGTLYSLRTDGSGFTSLFQFVGGLTGSSPSGDLLLYSNVLYGVAGGGTGDGLIFTYALTAPNPSLAITKAGTNVVLSWTNSPTGFALQSATNLGASIIWSNVSPSPTLTNNFNYVTNPLTPTRKFYRLIK